MNRLLGVSKRDAAADQGLGAKLWMQDESEQNCHSVLIIQSCSKVLTQSLDSNSTQVLHHSVCP